MEATTTSNISWIPSAADLLLVVPRLAQKAGLFAIYMPEAMDNIAGKIWNGGSIIADATAQQTANSTITNTSAFVQSTAAVLDAAVRESWQGNGDEAVSLFGLMAQAVGKLKNFGGIFSYLTSKWALATFTVAIILNRTQFYASSREHLRLRWHVRLGLYIIPISAFVVQTVCILEALRCQTSPDFAELRYGDPLKQLAIDFAGEGGFLYKLSSTLLFWQDDALCCAAQNMSLPALEDNKSELRGSMSLLFWFFLTLCTSQLFETLTCALQGKQPVPETGMTIFEHSLAFAECEAMISSALGFGLFGLPKLDGTGEASSTMLSRSEILQRLNVPPEVLLVCLISCFSHVASATLAVLGIRHKVRLVNTAIWACCYMSAFLWSFTRVFLREAENVSDLGVLRFPTVCIVGFIPHMLILVGIMVCGSIYALALVVTALSVPEEVANSMSFGQRLSWAYQNLQANVQFSSASSIRIKMSEDFYTTLLKIGFNVLTAASEAVYLNEGSRIHVAQMTWLEQKRIDELASGIEKRKSPAVPSELLGEGIARGVEFVDSQNAAISRSPYARERRSKPVSARENEMSRGVELDSGLGITQRRSRMQLTFDFVAGIFWLVVGIQAHFLIRMLNRLGIEQRPAWLLKAAGIAEGQRAPSQVVNAPREQRRDFWMVGPHGILMVPQNDEVDVENETRRRLQHAGNYVGEDGLGDELYDWWRGGGWFGNVDSSGDYQVREHDDDLTSMISMSTNDSFADEDEDDSGRRTPTQRDPRGTREDTPASEGGLDLTVLSRLLNPQSATEREAARLLSYSLQSSRPMTRSQYRRNVDRSRAQLLNGIRGSSKAPSEEDEERDLEHFILGQRSRAKSKAVNAGTWESGAEGMGAGGPQCVVSTGETAPQNRENDRQHGLRPIEPSASLSPADNTGAGLATPSADEQLALDEALARSLQDADKPRAGSGVSLSPQRTPSPPSAVYNRITEYEKASTPPRNKSREGPAFRVVKKQRSPNDERSPIQELPNEVLTHALAHLAPTDLTSVALVSKRFHNLVTGPHAWRSAFAHYFPGQNTLDVAYDDSGEIAQDAVLSEKRAFTRLTALASWRSEYIMRTRLLRSLGRGKPAQVSLPPTSGRSGQSHNATAITMYNSQLFTTINHVHANFGSGMNKKLPRFIHAADDVGMATSSDPNAAKVDNWGLSDPQQFLQFNERFPGDAQYGLGPGEVVGVPNVMDVSQPYGMVHGEGSPGGMAYFRSTEEQRGRFLAFSSAISAPELGIPRIYSASEAVTSVWVAKSAAIPSLTEGLIGILAGSSLGVVTAYSLGSTTNGNSRDQRFGRGEMTARWVLSPGVPIIGIAVDAEHSLKRQAQNRIWAVVLNALGEVFYLTKFPKRAHVERGARPDDETIERTAWLTGRTVYWNVVEASRRVARLDPYAESGVDGSYSPRSSWNGMCLSKEQTTSETREIEAFIMRKPKEFHKACAGWDMRRKLDVDFAGDDGNNAGENVIVFECGLDEDSSVAIKRYTRCRFQDRANYATASTPPLTSGSTVSTSSPSLFGSPQDRLTAPVPDFSLDRLEDSLSRDDFAGSITPRPVCEEWRVSSFDLHGFKHMQIFATTMDNSVLATQTISEDPLLNMSSRSTTSSPWLSPSYSATRAIDPADMPGQRARLFAIGTATGSVLIWNVRSPPSRSAESVNTIEPVRIIQTDSPQISCLAMSSLYLVHGGNDGYVQAWDPLGSNTQPIRTLNSRFSSRARRRLVQAQASPQGVGINLFAAGAICLDPDPTVLRGMVSLGTHLRYWSYSSSAADQYKSHKRRHRRSERGSNNGGERFSGAARGNLKDYIANERYELDREKQQRQKDAERFAGRFGTGLLDGSEEEMMAYAAMLSQETLEQERAARRASDTSTVVSTDYSTFATADPTPSASPSPRLSTPKSDEEFDADVAEAIRLSLGTSPGRAPYEVPIRQAKPKGRKGSSARPSPRASPMLAGSSKVWEMSDMEFALQLSLAEEQSRRDVGVEYPALGGQGDGNGKGKGKSR
ncbi:hypothetical protein BAUCODRAFT_160611 [Baudoinia panamericana UAMH 10762]|uniref:F-box domain-containing protein n=1 Tax=Baudoinia panamericana (strain UAMH 10762) TaxID=717646 RepID=M2MKZ8_BAUPA|nr:uncharacterized protein BAUCODRAFT_160611 [Baudoinia panamericana UAMH 10762]EMC92003.1 hypothetical protein BAUCODRAFT_160611 [Baudoinia panamericana UAMH 10762]